MEQSIVDNADNNFLFDPSYCWANSYKLISSFFCINDGGEGGGVGGVGLGVGG